jgi:hypothetical protein
MGLDADIDARCDGKCWFRLMGLLKTKRNRWCREGEFFFGDPIFPITLAKLPHTSGLAKERTLLICPI